MRVGYARTSTTDQQAGLAAQERDLKAAGCEKTFVEQLSSVAKARPQLEAAIDFAREGDEFVTTKMDRLARSVEDLIGIEKRLASKGVALRILGTNIETATPSGRLMFHVFGAVAEFERALMLERQREGIAKAKAEGKYRGRKPTARARAGEVHRLDAENIDRSEIARRLGISRASLYRILKANDAA
jgi:DNA invertase Pin-like site-specific DNA recombinase